MRAESLGANNIEIANAARSAATVVRFGVIEVVLPHRHAA